jgi:phospholipid/cholesterol/gamma-HCH transport system substrate-binding protein
VLKAVQGLDQLVQDLGDVTKALNNPNGTFGKLVRDPMVYNNVNQLMINANDVLSDIRGLIFNLKPVVYNARVFTDKIATEPGRLINGAISPSVVK